MLDNEKSVKTIVKTDVFETCAEFIVKHTCFEPFLLLKDQGAKFIVKTDAFITK